MSKEEAIYWKAFIIRVIEEKIPLIQTTEADAIRISEFAKNYMEVITGQQYVPQGLFREFLEIFSHIPQIQKDIEQAQAEIREIIDGIVAELHPIPLDKIEALFSDEEE